MALQTPKRTKLVLKSAGSPIMSNVTRERQYGKQWCWAACVSMVLKASGKNVDQCDVAMKVYPGGACLSGGTVVGKLDHGLPLPVVTWLWQQYGINAIAGHTVLFSAIETELRQIQPRPIQVFFGIGDSTTEEGHLVLLIGAETTDRGPAVFIADPLRVNFGSAASFNNLDKLSYGAWRLTWTGLGV